MMFIFLGIPINNVYVAFVSSIGRISFFFGINTVFEVYQDAGMLFFYFLFCSLSQLR